VLRAPITVSAVVHPNAVRVLFWIFDEAPWGQRLMILVSVMTRPSTLKTVTGQQLFLRASCAEGAEIPVEPVVVPPPKVFSAAPGESFTAHHARRLVCRFDCGAALIVNSVEGAFTVAESLWSNKCEILQRLRFSAGCARRVYLHGFSAGLSNHECRTFPGQSRR